MSRMSNKSRIGLIAVALAGSMNLASTAFAADALPQGYRLAAAEKTSEGKCGEGKCGADGASAKVTKAGEGKCGEGKCGDASFARTDADHDGRVSLKELLTVAPKGAEEFKAMDTNNDGFLSEGEVYKFRTNQFTSNGKKVPTELFTKMSKAQG
ncbi:MAG: HvfA family oxazolone/thioamide-modified RiPP metallophore [Pseudomonas sp.]|uniref:HvfA family oxazolone/thioamide-modified RiPP metallophore n=1 Tax=Pseudomonas sp. TaxID=306 RepID=UPI003D6F355D